MIEDRPPEPDEPESSRLHFRKYTSEDFELLNLLGEGGFGKVRCVTFSKIINPSFFRSFCRNSTNTTLTLQSNSWTRSESSRATILSQF